MISAENLVKGRFISCLYPKSGRRNILCSQKGTIENVQSGHNGVYIVVRRNDGTVRSLLPSKMVNAKVFILPKSLS